MNFDCLYSASKTKCNFGHWSKMILKLSLHLLQKFSRVPLTKILIRKLVHTLYNRLKMHFFFFLTVFKLMWNFQEKILRIGNFENLSFFWVGHFEFPPELWKFWWFLWFSSKFLAMQNITLYSVSEGFPSFMRFWLLMTYVLHTWFMWDFASPKKTHMSRTRCSKLAKDFLRSYCPTLFTVG